jgi:hypothetical protein
VVKGLRLRPTKRGATLSIQASRSVPVGIVHQSESGLVRLVIEADDALPSVLSQHAAIDGARITSVRRGRDSVFVTLTLQPGWALGSIQRVAGGARMELIRP